MDTISFPEFQKLDIRIGTVVSVSIPEGSQKLYRLEVDCGELGTRTVFAGIKNAYQIDELKGKQIVVLTNLASKKFFNEDSGGMLLAASGEEGAPVILQLKTPVTFWVPAHWPWCLICNFHRNDDTVSILWKLLI